MGKGPERTMRIVPNYTKTQICTEFPVFIVNGIKVIRISIFAKFGKIIILVRVHFSRMGR